MSFCIFPCTSAIKGVKSVPSVCLFVVHLSVCLLLSRLMSRDVMVWHLVSLVSLLGKNTDKEGMSQEVASMLRGTFRKNGALLWHHTALLISGYNSTYVQGRRMALTHSSILTIQGLIGWNHNKKQIHWGSLIFLAHLCLCTVGSSASLSVRPSVTPPKLRWLENNSYLGKYCSLQHSVVCKLQVYETLAGGLTSTSSCIFSEPALRCFLPNACTCQL